MGWGRGVSCTIAGWGKGGNKVKRAESKRTTKKVAMRQSFIVSAFFVAIAQTKQKLSPSAPHPPPTPKITPPILQAPKHYPITIYQCHNHHPHSSFSSTKMVPLLPREMRSRGERYVTCVLSTG